MQLLAEEHKQLKSLRSDHLVGVSDLAQAFFQEVLQSVYMFLVGKVSEKLVGERKKEMRIELCCVVWINERRDIYVKHRVLLGFGNVSEMGKLLSSSPSVSFWVVVRFTWVIPRQLTPSHTMCFSPSTSLNTGGGLLKYTAYCFISLPLLVTVSLTHFFSSTNFHTTITL